jgi:ATP-dependent helicase HrpB
MWLPFATIHGMAAVKQPLPIDGELPQIVREVGKSAAVVLVAEPGAGKTTRLPPALLRGRLFSPEHRNIVMLQPRRVAARAAAARIADENNWQLGQRVGYHIRFEKRLGPETRLRVLTEGVLTRQLLADPFLAGTAAVILDEFHERSIHTDLALAMLREAQTTVRPDLKIIIMSATLDAEPAAKFLGDCPVIRVPGRTFPVEIEYSPRNGGPIVESVTAAIEREVSKSGGDDGDILVFLPGADEIRRAVIELQPLVDRFDLTVRPLHGRLAAEEQTRALAPSEKRKVILATNIAETSLTIDGVTTVIDSGLARVPAFDPRRGLDRLDLKQISQASATQRAGRAGRTRPGRCVRLWSAKEQGAMEEHELPEIQRVDLCATVLDLFAWGKSDPFDFNWFQAPPEASVKSAMQLLEMLGAVDAKGITAIGKRLTKLPVHPRLGRLLIAAAEAEHPREGAGMAALLSEPDPLRRQPGSERAATSQGESDLLLRLQQISHPTMDFDHAAHRQVQRTREDLYRLSRDLTRSPKYPGMKEPAREANPEVLLRLPLLAYPDRVCRRRESDPSAGVMVGGGGVRLAPESIVRKGEFFVALDARNDPRSPKSEAIVSIASAIHVDWLAEIFPQSISREQKTVYDEARERVVGLNVVKYRDLVLSEDRDSAIDPEDAARTLAAALRPKAGEIFAADENAGNFLNRLNLLRKWMPEHPWPQINLEQVLEEVCRGRKSLEEVKRAPLAAALGARLAYPLDRVFAENAPEAIGVPTGNQIRLTYSANGVVVLAVRLQEIFGWTDTPRVAGGRVAVLLHLLGPNYRPVQITDDLRSFWSGTYFQVRKDLRVRYPKHSWPEEPLLAKPVAKGRPRR